MPRDNSTEALEESAPAADPNEIHTLEEGKRFSESMLWDLQRRYFDEKGIGAWAEGQVPSFITTNAVMARSYARIVHGFLRDALAWQDGGINLDHPIYVIELGAGSGRLGFHFIKKFADIMAHSPINGLDVRLVMTDFPERTLESWQANPKLRALVDAGKLDFARFDMEQDAELYLTESGVTLSPGDVVNPVIVLANYVFDGIRHDVFFLEAGELKEGLVKVLCSKALPKELDTALFDEIALDFDKNDMDADYYGDPDLDGILEEYKDRLAQTALLFPAAGMDCIRRLAALSGGRMLMLASDKGYLHEENLIGHPAPSLVSHGSFSLSVNFHALGRFVNRRGGQVIDTPYKPSNLATAAWVLGSPEDGLAETRLAFYDAVVAGGMDDFFSVTRHMAHAIPEMSLDDLISYLRFGGWDATMFAACASNIEGKLTESTHDQQRECYNALMEMWDNYLPIGEEMDLPFFMGTLLYKLEHFEEAHTFLKRSLDDHGEDAATYYNLGLALRKLNKLSKALKALERAHEMRPGDDMIKTLLISVRADVKKGDGKK